MSERNEFIVVEPQEVFRVQEIRSTSGAKIAYIERSGDDMYIEAKGWLAPESARALISILKECYQDDLQLAG